MQPITRYVMSYNIVILSEYLANFYKDYPIRDLDSRVVDAKGDVQRINATVKSKAHPGR